MFLSFLRKKERKLKNLASLLKEAQSNAIIPLMNNLNNQIEKYIKLLKNYNEKINIYSQGAYEHLDFHIQDSLNLAEIIGNQKFKVVDLGSGAGFPSVLIALKNPNNQVIAVESKSRKTKFLELVKKELMIQNFTVITKDFNEVISNIKTDYFTAKAFKKIEDLIPIFQKKVKTKAKLLVPVSKNQIENLAVELKKNIEVIEYSNFYYFVINNSIPNDFSK